MIMRAWMLGRFEEEGRLGNILELIMVTRGL